MGDIEIIHAGFPRPSLDYEEADIDFNKLLKLRPAATFYGRVKGKCMLDDHIPPQAILIIDKSIKPAHNCIIVAVLEGDLYLKRLVEREGKRYLTVADKRYKPIPITNENPLDLWGTVIKIIIDPKESQL